MSEAMKVPSPCILVLITDPAHADDARDVLRRAGVPIQYSLQGRGTASGEMLAYLGLDAGGRTLYLCAIPRAAAGRLLVSLRERLQLDRPGRGIAFTVPISGISAALARRMDDKTHGEMLRKVEKEVEKMARETEHALLLVIANRGYSEEIMETARAIGVTGGTVLGARHLGMEEPLRFWGISIQEEREIIAIVTDKGIKADVMRAIGEKHGMRSEARGVVVAVPVEDIAGIDG